MTTNSRTAGPLPDDTDTAQRHVASRRIRALSEQRMPLQEFVELWLAAIEKRRLMRLTKGLWPR